MSEALNPQQELCNFGDNIIPKFVKSELGYFWKPIFTGSFEGTYDYGYRLLHLSLEIRDKNVILTINTKDDGMWRAFYNGKTDEENDRVLKELIEYFDDMRELPEQSEINSTLMFLTNKQMMGYAES